LRDEYVRWLRAEAARVEADPECELPHSGDAPDRLLYPDAGRVRSIAICSHGVLGELKRFAVACSEGFRSGWSEEGAVRFALTGEMPWIVWGHIRVTYGVVAAAPQISITVHPRVAPKDLLAAYVRTREELIDGRESRRLDRKQAALAVFAEESTWAPAGWVELRERWNSEYRDRHPEWHYGAKGDPEARRFALDARSAWKRVTGEPWHDRRRRSQ
jgi:hypothetical protein